MARARKGRFGWIALTESEYRNFPEYQTDKPVAGMGEP